MRLEGVGPDGSPEHGGEERLPQETMLEIDVVQIPRGREAGSSRPVDGGRARAQAPRRPVRPRPSFKLTAGDELEIRLAHVWMVEGSFTRRGINLRYADSGETRDITDIDLYALDFDGALRSILTIGEAKGGVGKSAPSAIDRSVWLRGLRELTRAHRAELTLAQRQSSRSRGLAAGLGIDLQSIADLDRRETASGAEPLSDFGSHSKVVEILRDNARRSVSADPDLNRAYQYLRGDVWFADPWAAAKRLVATVKLVTSQWTPNAEGVEQEAIRWMLAESIIAFSLISVRLAGVMLPADPARVAQEVGDKLAEGAAPMSEMKQLSDSVDHYLSVVLDQHRVPRSEIVAALGAFQPSPPVWAEAFAELLKRLGADAVTARDLPRFVDFVVSERLVRRRSTDPVIMSALGFRDPDGLRRLFRSVVAFLEGQIGLPRDVAVLIIGDS